MLFLLFVYVLLLLLLLFAWLIYCVNYCLFFFFNQKTAYEMLISDWSSDVCSSDLRFAGGSRRRRSAARVRGAEGEAAGRGPVRRRAQTPPARLGAPAGRADLALWRGGARRAQRAGAALPAAGRGGAAGAGAGCDGGDRKSTRLNSSH